MEDLDWGESEGVDASRIGNEESGGGGATFYRTVFLSSLLDGSKEAVSNGKNFVYVRWLGDFRKNPDNPEIPVWIEANHHSGIPTKSKPDYMDKDRRWPEGMGAVCRKSKAFLKRYGGECYICSEVPKNTWGRRPFPSSRNWLVGVLREAVIGDGTPEMGGSSKKGRKIGFRDKMVECVVTDENGEVVKDDDDNPVTEMRPQYVYAHQAWENFFLPLSQWGEEYGTIMDRDYKVVREGTGTDTDYNLMPQEPIQVDISEESDGSQMVDYDLSQPGMLETFYPDVPDVRVEIARQASDDYLKHWFLEGELSEAQEQAKARAEEAKDEGKSKGGKSSSKGKGKTVTKAPASASKAREANEDVLASMRARLQKR